MSKAPGMVGFRNIGNPIFLQKILAEGGMNSLHRNDLSRYYGLLDYLRACPSPGWLPTGTDTSANANRDFHTIEDTDLHSNISPHPNPHFTPTPEPAWYQPLNPSMGALKYNYAQVNNPKARVYVSLQDAVAKTGNFGTLPNYPAYVAYTTTETRDGRTFYFDPVYYGWMDGADLQVLTPSKFTGILVTREVNFRFGWVLGDNPERQLSRDTHPGIFPLPGRA